MNRWTFDQVWKRVTTLAKQAVKASGVPFKLRMVIGHKDDFPEARDHAFCSFEDGVGTLTLAPKCLRIGTYRLDGLLMHELAHLVYLAGGEPEHSEAETDALAEHLFGVPIRYDAELVQTTNPRAKYDRRPACLPTGLEDV